MPVEVTWKIEPCLDDLEGFLSRVADACFAAEGIPPCWFSVEIVDGPTIRAVNRETRQTDAETDVLSFPSVRYPAGRTARDCPKRLRAEYDPSVGMVNLGDCVLNLGRAREQAREFGHSLTREVGYLTAHSAFHLMGYDHMTDEDRRAMRGMEKAAMRSLKLYRESDTMTDEKLFEMACEAMKNAYAPYSHYLVGACLLAEDGTTYQGCNIENASYGAAICAERAAICNAVSHGQRSFTAIAIAGSGSVAWPCGICRQVLREFAPDIRVIAGQAGHGFTVSSLPELLPNSFGPENL